MKARILVPAALVLAAALAATLLPWPRWWTEVAGRGATSRDPAPLPEIRCPTTFPLPPGQPFVFDIALTPPAASLRAAGLPDGWRLRPQPPAITGTAPDSGHVPVYLVAISESGSATRTVVFDVTPVLDSSTQLDTRLPDLPARLPEPPPRDGPIPLPPAKPQPARPIPKADDPPSTNSKAPDGRPPARQLATEVHVQLGANSRLGRSPSTLEGLERELLSGMEALVRIRGRFGVADPTPRPEAPAESPAPSPTSYRLQVRVSRFEPQWNLVGGTAHGDSFRYDVSVAYTCSWVLASEAARGHPPANPASLSGVSRTHQVSITIPVKKRTALPTPDEVLAEFLRLGTFAKPEFVNPIARAIVEAVETADQASAR